MGLVLFPAPGAHAQTTSFTYQGRLQDAGAQANGSYDLQFSLFDASTGGNQLTKDLEQVSAHAWSRRWAAESLIRSCYVEGSAPVAQI
jgi:hypothetical protein